MFLRHIIAAVVLATMGGLAASLPAAEPEEIQEASAVRTCGGGTIRLGAKEERILRLHNRARKSRGIRPLCVHPALTKAARSHSTAMLRKDRLWHGKVGRRLKRFGYHWRTYAENIAWGSGSRGSPKRIFRGWMKSRGHRSNILNRRFREVGVGVETGTFKGTRRVSVYTVDFGKRR